MFNILDVVIVVVLQMMFTAHAFVPALHTPPLIFKRTPSGWGDEGQGKGKRRFVDRPIGRWADRLAFAIWVAVASLAVALAVLMRQA